MTERQLETLKQQLSERREALLAEMREHVSRSREDNFPALASSVGDDADQALTDLLRDTDNATIGRDVQELRDVEAALGRIADGHYGECINCGEAIGYPRLSAHPTAVRCLRCQSLYEKTYAHPGEPSL